MGLVFHQVLGLILFLLTGWGVMTLLVEYTKIRGFNKLVLASFLIVGTLHLIRILIEYFGYV